MITLSSGGLAVAVLLVVLTLAIRRGVGPIGVVVAAVAGGAVGFIATVGSGAASAASSLAPMLNAVGGG